MVYFRKMPDADDKDEKGMEAGMKAFEECCGSRRNQ